MTRIADTELGESAAQLPLPPLLHLKMLDAWGGMEQVFSELWDLPGVAGPVITWGRALHPDYLRRTPGIDAQRIDVKSLSGIRIPSRPRGLRA